MGRARTLASSIGKAKSMVLSDEGVKRSEDAFLPSFWAQIGKDLAIYVGARDRLGIHWHKGVRLAAIEIAVICRFCGLRCELGSSRRTGNPGIAGP